MFGGMSFANGATQNTPERQRRPEDRTPPVPCFDANFESAQMENFLPESANEAATDGELHFHGSETSPSILLLLAQVEAIHAQQKNMAEFTVCDGTGTLRVRFFATDGEAQESVRLVSETGLRDRQEKALQTLSVDEMIKDFETDGSQNFR
eukprot:Skav213450  [mRNA]  locus=scaffold837:491291:499326:- [translate_table: standard]